MIPPAGVLLLSSVRRVVLHANKLLVEWGERATMDPIEVDFCCSLLNFRCWPRYYGTVDRTLCPTLLPCQQPDRLIDHYGFRYPKIFRPPVDAWHDRR